jgi:hypothetical protein
LDFGHSVRRPADLDLGDIGPTELMDARSPIASVVLAARVGTAPSRTAGHTSRLPIGRRYAAHLRAALDLRTALARGAVTEHYAAHMKRGMRPLIPALLVALLVVVAIAAVVRR